MTGDTANRRWTWPGALAALGVWAFFLWRAISAFAPRSTAFESDAAIPVLMSNDTATTPFSLYYYAADRWGAWPFLVARLIGRLTGYRWSVDGVFVLQALWIFIGVWAIASLTQRHRVAAGVAYVIVLGLNAGRPTNQIFNLSQVYAWQVTSLLLAWAAMRRVTGGSGTGVSGRVARWAWIGLLSLWSCLATWSSVASIPLLGFLFCLELWRASGLPPVPGRVGSRFAPALSAAGALVYAVVAEAILKSIYHRYSLAHYGSDYRWQPHLDIGHLWSNLFVHLRALGVSPWWPFYALPVIIAAVCLWRGRPAWRWVRTHDTAVLIAGLSGMSAINLMLTVAVDHVRQNFNDPRYLTITCLFGAVAGGLTLWLLIERYAGALLDRHWSVRPALVAGSLVVLAVVYPQERVRGAYDKMVASAGAIAAQAPNGVLLSGYWETYVFAALQPTGTMTPVPAEGQMLRTPWTPPIMQRAPYVVVEYRHSKLGSTTDSPQRLYEYGCTLKLLKRDWYVNPPYAFALYRNECR